MRTTPRFAPGIGSVGRPNSDFNPASNNLEIAILTPTVRLLKVIASSLTIWG